VKRTAAILLVVVLVLGLGIWFLWQPSRNSHPQNSKLANETVATDVAVSAVTSSTTERAGQTAPLLGETILRDYASPNLPPENDLTLMSRLMENSLLLLKSAANRPLSANEDWAALFRGQNAVHEQLLPAQHVALNAQGQLVDRWGAPLFFHALGGGRYEIRSAGPDSKLWTTDDIHRNADGSFRRGAELDSPSLMETATRGRSPATAP
jgi:hypothetical protein